jgi:hypothetical protein
MRMTLGQLISALGARFIGKNFTKGFDVLYTKNSMIITEEEFFRVFTKNKNGYWECWGIEYTDIQCLYDLKKEFLTNENHYINCEEEQNPYYEIEMKRLGMI